jgi:Mg-chelatase subunit ChlD
MNHNDKLSLIRWRLILGVQSPEMGFPLKGGGDGQPGDDKSDDDGGGDLWQKRDRVLGFLYDREYNDGRNTRRQKERNANLGDSAMSVPDWLNSVTELFPRTVCERLEKDAIERYQIEEFLNDPQILARTKPSPALLRSIMRTKNLMNQEVLLIARDMVRKIVRDMLEKLAEQILQPFSGARNRSRRSLIRISQNFDAAYTIKRNLKHYSVERKQIVIEKPYFYSRLATRINRWKIIIVVDQSGSMVDSVIHSAVTASIFHSLPFTTTHLIAFDTNVVDLTSESIDPVETLMKVQLGGGTDIGQAMSYARNLVEDPANTIVILISDFFEGPPPNHLLSVCHKLVESRVKVLGLAALDYDCTPNYNRALAAKLVRIGVEIGAMTPGELADWVAQKVGLK